MSIHDPSETTEALEHLSVAPAGAIALIEPPHPVPQPRRRRLWLLLLLLPVLAAAGYWWLHRAPALPPGFAFGNGRLEADAIDIDTKFAGRIEQLLVDEGDMASAGQVLAVMDTSDLEASLKKSQAIVGQDQRALDEARANLDVQRTQLTLARQELDRTATLVTKGYATVELLDQRRQQVAAATSGEAAATARVAMAEHGLEAAEHDVELYRINIADNTLRAPREGRIQYRVANVGEVLPVGGKIFTMLDTAYVYMDIYLPTAQAGRLRLGSEARIVLDAYPNRPIPATVAFIASQAQFTPKAVETSDERDKLMFRIRVRIDSERMRGRASIVRSGLPGIAYVRTDPPAVWPERLQPVAAP